MISLSIAKYLSNSGLGLSLSKNLFAETGQGDKHVVVSATVINGDPHLSFVRLSALNIRVVGYSAATGLKLADDICNALAAMQPQKIDNCEIKGVTVRNWPTIIPNGNGTFTMNLTVSYKAT